MRQLNYTYGGQPSYDRFLASVREQLEATDDGKVLFHFLVDTADRAPLGSVIARMRETFPTAPYVGGSTGGSICDGAIVCGDGPSIVISCSLFEDADTRVEVRQLPLDRGSCVESGTELVRLVAERPWVKAVEMLTTLDDVSMEDFRLALCGLRDDIVFFGGGVLTPEERALYSDQPFVCSSDGTASDHCVAFVLYGGERLHAHTQAIKGWQPFGLPLRITRAQGPVLYELDGQPAFERYRHYLAIENDADFAKKSLVFPFVIEREGRTIVKDPLSVGPDGSLVMTSDLAPSHRECRIAYGDPSTILQSVRQSAESMRRFAPQGILAFSCAARRMYWGVEGVSRETLPFQAIAPVVGFYTGGEFAREGASVVHHNVTLVVAGLREGDAHPVSKRDVRVSASEFSHEMTLVHSLAAFVGVMSAELSVAYERMERMARFDGLTGICNRREIESFLGAQINPSGIAPGPADMPSVVMLDIDDFKVVNDVYGHKAGDDVLRGLGDLLRRMVDEKDLGRAGRWGGEEFMVVLPRTSRRQAREVAQELCDGFADCHFPTSGRHTLSVGVAQALPGEMADLLCQRVDRALYAAKEQGKNRVVSA